MDDEYFGPPADIMSLRAGMMAHLAAQVNETNDPKARKLLIQAMDALLYTINPPRGEVKEVRH
jgi:hypothetical protein